MSSSAQSFYAPPAQLGDKLPITSFAQALNEPYDSIDLRSVNKPLIILDIWATRCAACIYEFPKLDSLQDRFGDSVSIFLLNHRLLSADSASKVDSFITAYRKRHPRFSLPVILDSSLLFRYKFPIKGIPHYIWLDSDLRILAETGGDQLTAETIANALAGKLPYPMQLDRYQLSPTP